MAENSKIEWCDHTFNPWMGCTAVSPACDNCYAEAMMDKRLGKVRWGKGQPRQRTSAANWEQPFKWSRQAAKAGTRPRVFCASLADVFDAEVDPLWRENLFTVIDQTPNLDWLLLTKRPKLAYGFFQTEQVPPNVWIGTTAENQKMLNSRWEWLRKIPAKVRFLSMEPLLEKVSLKAEPGPDWIIVGGESGKGARTMNPDWARLLRYQCEILGIPFFFKQMTKKAEIPTDLMVREFPSPDRSPEND